MICDLLRCHPKHSMHSEDLMMQCSRYKLAINQVAQLQSGCKTVIHEVVETVVSLGVSIGFHLRDHCEQTYVILYLDLSSIRASFPHDGKPKMSKAVIYSIAHDYIHAMLQDAVTQSSHCALPSPPPSSWSHTSYHGRHTRPNCCT